MDCCGRSHAVAHHPFIWSVPLASTVAMPAGEVGPRGSTDAARTAENASAALDVLRKSISVDVHSHGGSTGITSNKLQREESVIHVVAARLDHLTPRLHALRDRTGDLDTARLSKPPFAYRQSRRGTMPVR